MAWTEITRRKYRRDGLRYASHLMDAEWALIEPLLPRARDLSTHSPDSPVRRDSGFTPKNRKITNPLARSFFEGGPPAGHIAIWQSPQGRSLISRTPPYGLVNDRALRRAQDEQERRH